MIDVLIVGAGPVGIVTALQLAGMDVRTVAIDRSMTPTRFPKMDISNARTMELFETLGIAADVRRIGVAEHYSFDVIWTTDWNRPPVAVWDLPSVATYRKAIIAGNDGTQPAQPYQRLPQSTFERYGREQLAAHQLIDFRPGWSFAGLDEDGDGVTVTVADPSGADQVIRARYVIACDGAESDVRKSLSIRLTGQTDIPDMYMVHFESDDRRTLHRHGQFWHVFGSRGLGMIAQDEQRCWTAHAFLAPGEDLAARPPAEVVSDRLGSALDVSQVLLTSGWRPQMLIADSYGTSRVLLAGDAVHQVFPTGGYGMNTGVGDGFDIGWKVGAVIRGWGGPELIASYARERRPVTVTNCEMAGRHAAVHLQFHEMSRVGAAPDAIGRFLQDNRGENEFLGVELDYRLLDSHLIVRDGTEAPAWNPARYTPSTWPGSRAPSVILPDGVPLYSKLARNAFTLVDFTADGDGRMLTRAASEHGVPMRHLRIDDGTARELWQRDLVLIRPDHFVAWRGNALPASPGDVLSVVTGRHHSEMCT
jgi:2-polyprenyl-6-methoxyphenol hydroxylase-like FAD-dependent oxidoreductase